MTKARACKDCDPGSTRPAPHPGPRCATHHRAELKRRRTAAADTRVAKTYGITGEQYAAIYAHQGGACAICARATGKVRRLAVDHDHQQARLDGHPVDQGCPACVRGLLCKTCNRTLGHYRDDPAAFERAASYLRAWPSRTVLTATGRPTTGT